MFRIETAFIFALGIVASLQASGTVDTTPPTVQWISPQDGAVVHASYVRVTARVQDDRLGVTNSWCNGLPTTIADDGLVTCDLSIVPGRNALIVEAMDRAGNSGSSGITVVVPRATDELVLEPARLTLAFDEHGELRLRDASGPVAPSSVHTDPEGVILADVFQWGVMVTGLRPGTTTIKVNSGSRSAVASVTVLPGAVAPGTVRWELPALEEASIEELVASSNAEVFVLERDAAGGDSALLLRSVSRYGAEVSRERPPLAPHERVMHLMGDGAMGATALVGSDSNSGVAIVKFAAAGQFKPWRYRSRGQFVSPMSGGGPIHIVEALYQGDPTVGSIPLRLDMLRLGVVFGNLLERHEVRWREGIGSTCKENEPRLTKPPILTGPTVGYDDAVSVLVEVEAACPPTQPKAEAARVATVSTLGLFRLTLDGTTTWTPIWKHVHGETAPALATFHPAGIMPYRESGVLVFDEKRAFRVQGRSVTELNLMPGATPALIGDKNRLFTAPTVTSINLETGTLDWVAPVQGHVLDGLEGGGVVVLSDDGRLHLVGSKGAVSESMRFLPLDDKTTFDDFDGGFNWEGVWWIRRRHQLISLAGPPMDEYCCSYHGGVERR
jgi:Glucodextranase, domain B